MKILLISDKPLWPATSGGALATRASATGLSQNGASVDVISAVTEKHPASSAPDKIKDSISGTYLTIPVSTKIRVFKLLLNLLFSKEPYNVARHRSKLFTQNLSEILKTNQYDIVQIEGINSTVYIDIIRSLSGAKIAYRAHNVESAIWKELATGEKSSLKSRYYNILASRLSKYEPEIISLCDILIPISNIDKDYFHLSGLNLPTFTCPFGVDNPDIFKTVYKSRDLIYIGSLDWRPNQEGLIWFLNKVWGKIIESGLDVNLSIAGRNAPLWLIDKLKLDGVEFLGEVENASEFISSGSLLIIPLLSGSGIRVRIIQAMSLGVPVITTSKGLQGIGASSDEGIVSVKNSNNFFKEIISALSNKNRLKDSGNNAREFILKNYCNRILNRDLLNFYSKHTL